MSKNNYRIEIMESERGWGQRYEYWNDYETLDAAIAHFNIINEKLEFGPVPDYYLMALHIEKKDDETGKWVKIYP